MPGDKEVQKVPKYTKEELMANAETLFLVKQEVIAGALYLNTQQEFTIAEMKGHIEKFLKRKVI